METVVRLSLNELNSDLIKSLKSFFKGKNPSLTLSIESEQDETEYLMSTEANRKALEKSLNEARSGKLISLKLEDLK